MHMKDMATGGEMTLRGKIYISLFNIHTIPTQGMFDYNFWHSALGPFSVYRETFAI